MLEACDDISTTSTDDAAKLTRKIRSDGYFLMEIIRTPSHFLLDRHGLRQGEVFCLFVLLS